MATFLSQRIAWAGLLGLLASAASAQAIPDRVALAGFLGSGHTSEQFEGLGVSPGAAWGLGVSAIDHTTPTSFGTGLLRPGAKYSNPNGGLVWLGAGGMPGLQSRALGTATGATGQLVIEYEVHVAAMGVDTIALANGAGLATFRDTSGAVIGTTPITFVAGSPVFVGWHHAAGIGMVEITAPTGAFSPSIDDHEFDLDPASYATNTRYGRGCNEAFASVYERHNAFDLSNTSLRFAIAGSGYRLTRGIAPVVPPTAAPVAFGNSHQVVPFPLGWAFPYPQGAVTTLRVTTYGSVHLGPYTYNPFAGFNLLTLAHPAFAAKYGVYYPGFGGTITFESDPVAQTATVTFAQVIDTTATPNTFQYYFDGTGTVEIRYGSCAANACLTGWSPGQGSHDPGSIDLSAITSVALPAVDVSRLDLAAGARPILGSNVDLALTNVPQGSLLTAHAFGLSRLSPPVNLAAYGIPGCFAYCAQDAVVLTFGPFGTTAVTLPVALPANPALAGVALQAQGLVYGPSIASPALAVLSSNGIELSVNIL